MSKKGLWFKIAGIGALLAASATSYGIEVEVEKDNRVPLAYVNVVITGGSALDPAGRLGLTQFLGQMLLRGTKQLTKEQFDLKLDQWGAQIGVETRAEFTVLRGAVLSEKLSEFLDLLEGLMIQPGFPEAEVQKLKAETTSSLMEELGNDHLISNKKFNQMLFEDHPYGRHTAGLAPNIQSIQKSDLIQHHLRLMNPNRIFFLASGDINESLFNQWANRVATKLPGRAPIEALEVPKASANRRVQIVDKPDRTQTQIQIGQIGPMMGDPAYYALALGNSAFGGGSFMSRLMQEIRVKRGWSYGASSSFRFGTRPRSWQAHLFPASKDTPAALALTLKLIEELRTNGITDQEFQLARASILNSSAFVADTPKKRIENRILEKVLRLPAGFFERSADHLKSVTLEQVNQALKEFLKPESLSISVLGTAREIRDGVAKAAGVSADQVRIVPYGAN